MTAKASVPALGPREEWMEAAPCSQVDPEIFFPESGHSSKPGKRICGLCPYKAPCLLYALRNGERFGIWGGLAAVQRRGLTVEALTGATSPVTRRAA